jgi:hypothetical protein
MRPASVDRQERPATVLAPTPNLPDDGSQVVALADDDTGILPSPESCELQVFLE